MRRRQYRVGRWLQRELPRGDGLHVRGEPSRCDFTKVEPNDTTETASAAGLASYRLSVTIR
ncbi:MAG TPA: hypothetical protein VEU33_51825 [Archangium sp.]|nr:hypothetical protein [Archangium sp.]